MEQIKVRKIGNSLGVILPKSSNVTEGALLGYEKQGSHIILDTTQADKEHDKALIETAFADFEKGLTLSKEDMKKRFGKYGWK